MVSRLLFSIVNSKFSCVQRSILAIDMIKNETNYILFTISVSVTLLSYTGYIFTHLEALVFQATGEYSYSFIVKGLATYGSFAFLAIWLLQLVWFFRVKTGKRHIKLLSWTNICLLPCIVLINVLPYTEILEKL